MSVQTGYLKVRVSMGNNQSSNRMDRRGISGRNENRDSMLDIRKMCITGILFRYKIYSNVYSIRLTRHLLPFLDCITVDRRLKKKSEKRFYGNIIVRLMWSARYPVKARGMLQKQRKDQYGRCCQSFKTSNVQNTKCSAESKYTLGKSGRNMHGEKKRKTTNKRMTCWNQ